MAGLEPLLCYLQASYSGGKLAPVIVYRGFLQMKQFVAAAVAVAVLFGSTAYACTADEVQAKALAFSTKYQDLAKKDPQAASAWAQKYAAKQANPPQNLDEVCKFYDDLLATLPN